MTTARLHPQNAHHACAESTSPTGIPDHRLPVDFRRESDFIVNSGSGALSAVVSTAAVSTADAFMIVRTLCEVMQREWSGRMALPIAARTPLGLRLRELRARIVASGVPLLDVDGVERELADTRRTTAG